MQTKSGGHSTDSQVPTNTDLTQQPYKGMFLELPMPELSPRVIGYRRARIQVKGLHKHCEVAKRKQLVSAEWAALGMVLDVEKSSTHRFVPLRTAKTNHLFCE